MVKGRRAGANISSKQVRVDRVISTSNSKSSHPIRQHYVPQCLLRHFAIPGSSKEPKVHFYDKKLDKIGTAIIKSVASERSFYDFKEHGETFSLEKGLSEIEQLVCLIIDSILKHKSISRLKPDERTILADYIIKQLIRTKQSRITMKSMLASLEKSINSMPGLNFKDFFDDYEPLTDEHIDRISIDSLRESSISPEILLNKEWMLLETGMENPFITSDNPVARQNIRAQKERWSRGSIGLRSPFVEIYFPLSPTLCLSLVSPNHMQEIWKGYQSLCTFEAAFPERAFECWEAKACCESLLEDIRIGRASKINTDAVININGAQYLGCNRQVYSAVLDFRLGKQIKNDGQFEEPSEGVWISRNMAEEHDPRFRRVKMHDPSNPTAEIYEYRLKENENENFSSNPL